MIFITKSRHEHLVAIKNGCNDCVQMASKFKITKENAWQRSYFLEKLGLLTSVKVLRESGRGGFIAKYACTGAPYEIRDRKPYSTFARNNKEKVTNYERKGADFFMKHVPARIGSSAARKPLWAMA